MQPALDQARDLLVAGEASVPQAVLVTAEAMLERGLWFKLSRNPKVLSCRDAAKHRRRLGHVGIPLKDELRSYAATATSGGQSAIVFFHCRGDSHFDFDLAARHPQLAGFTFAKADVQEISDGDLRYGLLNPILAPAILVNRGARVIQVFDPSLLNFPGETGTMITNAGDFTWAIEFDPLALVKSEPSLGFVAPISVRDVDDSTRRTVGILTGNAPESGALLWRKLNAAHRRNIGSEFRGDVSYPRVLVHSLPTMGLSMEIADRDSFLQTAIKAEVEAMEQAGASVIGFACNTTQFYLHKLRDGRHFESVDFVSLADVVEKWVNANSQKRIFLAGIGHVTEKSDWSAFGSVLKLPNVVLPTKSQANRIQELAYEVKQNLPFGRLYQKFRSLLRSSVCETNLLLLTELSMIFDAYPRAVLGSSKVYDGMDLYAEEIAQRAIQLGPFGETPKREEKYTE